MRIMFFIFALFLGVCPAKASEQAYEPGTIGYVYEACMASLRESKSAEEFEKSYCGYFLSGTMSGFMHANWILMPIPSDDNPCKRDLDTVYKRIRGDEKETKEKAKQYDKEKEALQNLLRLKALGDFYMVEGKDKNIPDRPVTMAWRYTEINGKKLSTYLEDENLEKLEQETVNLDVLKGFAEITRSRRETTTLTAEYESCRNDIRMAAGNSQKFAETKCGAVILGFIAGLHSTKYLQYDRGEVMPICKKKIDDLYENLDVTTWLCLKENADPLWIAGLFVQTVDERRKAAEEEDEGSWGRGGKMPRSIVVSFTSSMYGKICKNPEPPPKRPLNE